MRSKFISSAVILLFLSVFLVTSQVRMSNAEYAKKYGSLAVDKMREYRIPASITLAQGILESGNGSSRLAVQANNHFGIKCGGKWTGSKIYHDDDARGECFRKYRTVEESYRDHSLFLTGNQRYSGLFSLDIMDYKGWARGLKSAGYATNPEYANILIRLIEDNELWRYDQGGSVGMNKGKGGLIGALIDGANKPSVGGHGKVVWERNNGVRYVLAQKGDTFESISLRTGISVLKLLKYNDLNGRVSLSEGVAVYTQRKKTKSRSKYTHEFKAGESMHSVSQTYGVRLESLYKLNTQYRYRQPIKGSYIKLR